MLKMVERLLFLPVREDSEKPSKESIFTGLNHLVINSIRNEVFSEGFGFTPSETEKCYSTMESEIGLSM